MKKRSKSEFHSRILSFDRNKKGKGGKIPLNPKTTYILRIQALSLFPEKYAQILNMSEKELNTDLQEILKYDRERRQSNENTKTGLQSITEYVKKISEIMRKYDVQLFPVLSEKEWEDLIIFSIRYELENWIEGRRESNFSNAKSIVRGRIQAKPIWWKRKSMLSPYKEYLEKSKYSLDFLERLTEEEYNQKIKVL